GTRTRAGESEAACGSPPSAAGRSFNASTQRAPVGGRVAHRGEDSEPGDAVAAADHRGWSRADRRRPHVAGRTAAGPMAAAAPVPAVTIAPTARCRTLRPGRRPWAADASRARSTG